MGKRAIFTAVTVMVLVAAMIGGATMAWFTDSDTSEPVTFTAGTLLVEAGTVSFYGVEAESSPGEKNGIYEILAKDDKVTYNQIGTSQFKDLNGAAFDRKNQRLYYANEKPKGQSSLYFYDLKTGVETLAGGNLVYEDKKQLVWGATFGMGGYWYVDKGTDDLYRVSFKEDGTVAGIELYHENFTGDKNLQFGDLAMDMREGIIYASTYSNPLEYFTYNIHTREYSKVGGANALNLQLAFGADGILYGHNTAKRTWHRIDKDTGLKTDFYTMPAGTVLLSDLASNVQNNWNPGDSDKVRYVFENKGTKRMVLRFTPELGWEANPDFYEGSLDLENITVSLCNTAQPNFNPEDWHHDRENNIFYYSKILAPGEIVALCLNVHLDGEGTGNDYQSATLTMNGAVEAIQATHGAPKQAWGVDFYEEGTEEPTTGNWEVELTSIPPILNTLSFTIKEDGVPKCGIWLEEDPDHKLLNNSHVLSYDFESVPSVLGVAAVHYHNLETDLLPWGTTSQDVVFRVVDNEGARLEVKVKIWFKLIYEVDKAGVGERQLLTSTDSNDIESENVVIEDIKVVSVREVN